MADSQFIVRELFPHNYPVVRGEFLRNPDALSEEKLADLVANGMLEKVSIVSEKPTKAPAKPTTGGEDAQGADAASTEVKNAKK